MRPPERGDRMLWIFAGTSYGLNVGGWARERAQKDRDGRAHIVRDQGSMPCGAGAMGDSRWVMVVWRT